MLKRIFHTIIFFLLLIKPATETTARYSFQEKIVVDSNYSLEEIFQEISIPDKIKNNLFLAAVEYFSFDGNLHRGQILVHNTLIKDLNEIFEIIRESKFPVGKVIPLNHYSWSDELSMNDNNTSAFNYRVVKGTTKLSAHSYGRAIDINPKLNPQIKNGKSSPQGSKYDVNAPGTISKNSLLVKEFKKRGWKWGGDWRSSKDYQHFEKLD